MVVLSISESGTEQVVGLLRSVGGAFGGALLRRVAAVGGGVIAAEIRVRAPVGRTGMLRRSVSTRTRETPDGAEALVKDRAPHAHLVEFGHRLVVGGRLRRGGRQIGYVPPHPFIRPALAASRQRAVEAAGQELVNIVQQLARAGGGA